MTLPISPPKPIQRPRLAEWMWQRDISLREAGDRLGRSLEYVRLIILPFDDPRRRKPDAATVELISAWTEGEVGAADFDPPADDLIAESVQ